MNPIPLPLAELKPALTGLGKVINRHATLPVLQCLRVERTPDGWVCLTGTDLDRFITVRLEQPAKGEPLALILPYDDLLKLAKNCVKDEVLQLAPSPQDSALITFTRAKDLGESRLRCLPVPEFPAIPKLKAEAIPLPEHVRTSLHEAMSCASSDETRYILNGACLDASKPDAHYLVGTDGRHLYSSNSFRLPLKGTLVIPRHKFLGWRDFNLDGEWQLKTGRPEGCQHDFVQLSSRRWRFLSKLIDGNYPNWKQVVPDPRKVKTTLAVDATAVDTLLRAIEILPCHDDTYRTLGLECREGQVHLMGRNDPEAPWVRTRVPQVKFTGTDVTVFLDRRLLIKALEFGLLNIGIIDAMSPLRFSQGGRQMIVMPVRVTAPTPSSVTERQPQPVAEPVPPPIAPVPPPPVESCASRNPLSHQPRTLRQPMPQEPPPSRAQDTTPLTIPPIEDVLQMVDAVREGCLRSAGHLKDLSAKLRLIQRGQRSSEREMQSFRQTLRSLQGVRL